MLKSASCFMLDAGGALKESQHQLPKPVRRKDEAWEHVALFQPRGQEEAGRFAGVKPNG